MRPIKPIAKKASSCAVVAAVVLVFPVLTGLAETGRSTSKHYSLPATPDNVQWGKAPPDSRYNAGSYSAGASIMKTCWKLAAVFGYALFPLLLISRTSFADEPAAREPGVWQKHEYAFTFMGFTSTYSCDGLADKLKILLIAAGARRDAKAQAGACASGFGRPDKFARADLTFYTLAPIAGDTPSQDKPVDGVWRPVAFTERSPRELGIGDCELIEQFRSNVLSMFTARNVNNGTTCVPHQDSGSRIDLRFESFVAAPSGTRAPSTRQGGT